MNEIDFPYKMKKNVISVSPLRDEPGEKFYWLSRTPLERLRHVEVLRWINYGDKATTRLQRAIEIGQNQES